MWGFLNTLKIAQTLVGDSQVDGVMTSVLVHSWVTCRAFLFFKHLQLFIIFQPKTGKWRENSRRPLYSLEEQNRNRFSFCVSDGGWCRCVSADLPLHTHRSLSLFWLCFFNASNTLVQYSLCPISPAVTQHHPRSASYSSKNLFFEKSSASPRSPFVRSLALGLSPPQVDWVFKVNVPLQEKVDKLIWWAPCCSVGSDSDRPVNLRNEV